MAKSIKISDEEMEILRREAKLSSRSLAGQAAHWLRIGRSIERSPQFSYARIRAALSGLRSPDTLSSEEQDVFTDELLGEAAAGTKEQEAFFAARKARGLGVGLDASGAVSRELERPG